MTLLNKTQQVLESLFPERSAMEADPTDGEPRIDGGQGPGVVPTDAAKHGHHLDVCCLPDQVVAVARILDREGFFLEAIAGVDWLERQQLEVIYDYNRLGGEHCRVMVRVPVPRNEPVVPTVSGVFPAADWHERETYDFYGIHFQGHPNLTRILLPEDADFHPLLKDYMP